MELQGPWGWEGLSTCTKQRKLHFQTLFLDGLIDLPTSIYWHNSTVEESGSQPKLLILMKARVFCQDAARTPPPCESVFRLSTEPTSFLLCVHALQQDSEVLSPLDIWTSSSEAPRSTAGVLFVPPHVTLS